MNALLADVLEFCEFLAQPGILRVKEVAQHVQLVPAMLGGQFRGGDEFEIALAARRGHARAAFHGVVVGERHGLELAARGVAGQFLRRVGAVGEICVKMEVGVHRDGNQ